MTYGIRVTSAWTADQVASIAPDATSLAAAHRLAGSWTLTGRSESALWGLCQGRGSKPYQSIVDLNGPAYKCSCPSRKFPCKHTLSLLVEWSAGRVSTELAPADFAAEWLVGREEKANQKQAPSAAPAGDSDAAQKRAVRVENGLDELDLWITDQIRGGLAAMDTSEAGLDAVAARMVDAQAPGVAGTLRTLAGVVASSENWPEEVLGELARLHLLVTAHRKLAELPVPLQDSVRAHIGYPVAADSVMNTAPARDQWMVMGVRVAEEKRLFSRTVWMMGRTTRRWSMLLDYSHGSPNFTTEVPPVGYALDADLHFYPGAAALRARLGTTHGEAQPFTTAPSGGIADAVQNYTDVVAVDPWLISWPGMIRALTPSYVDKSWFLVDESGTALAAEGDSMSMWTMLGISGGYPVTMFGTWNSRTFSPISVFVNGQVISL